MTRDEYLQEATRAIRGSQHPEAEKLISILEKYVQSSEIEELDEWVFYPPSPPSRVNATLTLNGREIPDAVEASVSFPNANAGDPKISMVVRPKNFRIMKTAPPGKVR